MGAVLKNQTTSAITERQSSVKSDLQASKSQKFKLMITILSSMPYGQAKPTDWANNPVHSEILKKTGRNTGNLLFHHASSILTAEPVFFVERGTKAKIFRFITRNSKALIVPVANLLNESVPVSPALSKAISASECPVIILGLGLQATKDKSVDSIDLPIQTVEFLRILSDKASLVCCRGEKTLRLCARFTDTSKFRALGCPSILISKDLSLSKTLQNKFKACQGLISNGTNPKVTYTVGNIIKFLGQAGRVKDSENSVLFEQLMMLESISNSEWNVVFQTEPFLFHALDCFDETHVTPVDIILDKMGITKSAHAHAMTNPYASNLGSRLSYFSSAKEWIRHLSSSDIAISQRIHGTIASISAGVPAACIYHDARTEELCKTMGIPSADINDALPEIQSESSTEGIVRIIDKCDFSRLDNVRKKYANELVSTFNSLSVAPSDHLVSIASAPSRN